MEVEVGSELRSVVSGIAQHYKPEDLTDKQVCLVTNLAPRKIKGIESQGMILMAENADGKLILLSPEQVAESGAEIR
jgi:methionyl-tRNA synthetase